MHPCLFIPELTLQIIAYLADDCSTEEHATTSRSPKNARDVARLARTCKTLSEPALDVLWKTQHSLVPLVMCLPSDAWNQGGTGKTIYLARDITPRDWASTTKYAHRIQAISHPKSFALPKLDDTVLAALLAPTTFGALFPALRILDYTVISVSEWVTPLTGILSSESRLRLAVPLTGLSVAFTRVSENGEVYELFGAIRSKATRLESLRIDSFAYTLTQPPEMKFREGELKYLKSLELSWNIRVSGESLGWVAGMGYLQELSLCMERDVDVNLLAGGRTFPALKRLKVNAYTLSQCTALLSLVTSSSLESISFLYDVQAPCTLLEVFFRQVQRTCSNTITACSPLPSSSSSRLRPSHSISLSLKHNLGPFTSVSPPFLIRPSGTLSPLLALPHLRALRLFGLGTVAMDDAFLKEAADAWGECLEELEVRGVPWRERNAWEERLKAATLGGVGAFVKRCWRLKNLRLTFDGRCVPEEGGRVVGLDADAGTRTDDDDDDVRADDKGHPHPMSPLVSSLQVLNVRDSPIDNPEGVAKFLRRIAPALRMIHVEGCMETSKMWKEVEGRIKSVESR